MYENTVIFLVCWMEQPDDSIQLTAAYLQGVFDAKFRGIFSRTV